MGDASNKPRVLVTGCTGYIAGWLCRTLVKHGYRVRGTTRDLAKVDRYAHLKEMGVEVVQVSGAVRASNGGVLSSVCLVVAYHVSLT